LNIRDILEQYKADERVKQLAAALNAGKNPRVALRGLVGSSDAAMAVALYFLQHKPIFSSCPTAKKPAFSRPIWKRYR
jgi:transcription-repair coupling factor (superfamily II helicase)